MKKMTTKMIASTLAMVIAISCLCGALISAGADTLPTSQCVTNLTGAFAQDAGIYGTLTVECDTADISTTEANDELILICLYANVVDMADPTNGGSNTMVILKSFSASEVITEGKLTVKVLIAPKKITGTCAVGIQVANRGENNDWVYAEMQRPTKRIKGDHDKDGFITSTDALMGLHFAALLTTPTNEQILDGDMNEDGILSISDALILLRIAGGLAPIIYYD